jgi:hypothetical protein
MSAHESDELSGLEQAVAAAQENKQIAIWDRAERPWAIAVYDFRTTRLLALSDEDAATLLNRDPLIRTEWREWNAMTRNRGSLILLDGEHVRDVLATANRDEAE